MTRQASQRSCLLRADAEAAQTRKRSSSNGESTYSKLIVTQLHCVPFQTANREEGSGERQPRLAHVELALCHHKRHLAQQTRQEAAVITLSGRGTAAIRCMDGDVLEPLQRVGEAIAAHCRSSAARYLTTVARLAAGVIGTGRVTQQQYVV